MPAAIAKFRRRKAKAPKSTWREGALVIFVRDGHFHVRGMVRHAGLKLRVRKSLEIPFSRENLDKARAEAATCEEKIRSELGGAAKPLSTAEIALGFMTRPKGQPLGATDVAAIKQLVRHFGTRILRDIAAAEFINFVEERQRGNTASTRERFLNTVVAFLADAIAKGQYAAMPKFKRDKAARNPTRYVGVIDTLAFMCVGAAAVNVYGVAVLNLGAFYPSSYIMVRAIVQLALAVALIALRPKAASAAT